MTRALIALVALFAMSNTWAQKPVAAEVVSAMALPSSDSNAVSLAPEGACCRAPAKTVVALEILDLLNSSQHKRGDKFRLRVIDPVIADGMPLIAAGTLGVGEIVHAAAARGGGAPGELLIAARSLDIDGQIVLLQGLKLGVTGGDNSGMALGVSFAAGPFAMFIRGREIEIPAGTRVNAKLAQEVFIPRPAQNPSPSTALTPEE